MDTNLVLSGQNAPNCLGWQINFNKEVFQQNIHKAYMALGGVNTTFGGKAVLKYATAEIGANWNEVVQYICAYLVGKSKIEEYENGVDWKSVCSYNVVLDNIAKQCKTQYAYKELVKMVVANMGLDLKSLVAESVLDAYGWHNIVTGIFIQYESFLRQCAAQDIKFIEDRTEEMPAETIVLGTPAPVALIEEGKKDEEVVVATEPTEKPAVKRTSRKKDGHSSKNKSVKQVFSDGRTRLFNSIMEATKETGISHSSISKNINGYEGYKSVRDKASGQKCWFEYVKPSPAAGVMVAAA